VSYRGCEIPRGGWGVRSVLPRRTARYGARINGHFDTCEDKGRERNRLALNRMACKICEIELVPRDDLENVEIAKVCLKNYTGMSRKSSFHRDLRQFPM